MGSRKRVTVAGQREIARSIGPMGRFRQLGRAVGGFMGTSQPADDRSAEARMYACEALRLGFGRAQSVGGESCSSGYSEVAARLAGMEPVPGVAVEGRRGKGKARRAGEKSSATDHGMSCAQGAPRDQRAGGDQDALLSRQESGLMMLWDEPEHLWRLPRVRCIQFQKSVTVYRTELPRCAKRPAIHRK